MWHVKCHINTRRTWSEGASSTPFHSIKPPKKTLPQVSLVAWDMKPFPIDWFFAHFWVAATRCAEVAIVIWPSASRKFVVDRWVYSQSQAHIQSKPSGVEWQLLQRFGTANSIPACWRSRKKKITHITSQPQLSRIHGWLCSAHRCEKQVDNFCRSFSSDGFTACE